MKSSEDSTTPANTDPVAFGPVINFAVEGNNRWSIAAGNINGDGSLDSVVETVNTDNV
jgi:hypothetical protein